ncbi:hypothetical protein MTO96_030429 [Rhipicephalus appendiculatus]
MKTLLLLTFLSIALQNLWFGVDPCTNVDASGCESDRRALTTKLMELHNSSINAQKTTWEAGARLTAVVTFWRT